MREKSGEPFILTDHPAADGTLIVSGGEARHLGRVLRARPGFLFVGFDGQGNGWLAEVTSVKSDKVAAKVCERLPPAPPLRLELSAAVGIVKGSRMDWAVEKACEVGASRLIPLLTEFGVVVPGGGRVERWRQIALSSAKQSRRLRLMEVEAPTALEQALAECISKGDVWALDNSPGCTPLSVMFASIRLPGRLSLFIGPEGGFSEGERALFRSRGIPAVGMGERPLRTETAVTVALGTLANLALAEREG